MRRYPEEMEKDWTPRYKGKREDGPQVFVPERNDTWPKTACCIKVRFLGVETETDLEGIVTVPRAVQALRLLPYVHPARPDVILIVLESDFHGIIPFTAIKVPLMWRFRQVTLFYAYAFWFDSTADSGENARRSRPADRRLLASRQY